MSNLLIISAVELSTIAYWTWIVIKVAIGLGAVIFVHELGHFLVAKACGVKCEKFFIGFDIGGYKLSRKWGETEYGIGILPLGGYVKMMGQDDDPAHIAEQMQKSQIDVNSPNAKQITGPRGEKYFVDRRSYLAKSVPQRMAIISAGVIMNVIFAFIFATVAYGMGVPYQPSIISNTIPGLPAWRAGIEPGDEIVEFGNRVDPSFTQLMGKVTLGDKEKGIVCKVRRADDREIVTRTLKPEQGVGRGLAKIGILSPATLTLAKEHPTRPESPASRAQFVEVREGEAAVDAGSIEKKLMSGDRVTHVGDVPILEHRTWMAQLSKQPDKPLRVTVERKVDSKQTDKPARADDPAKSSEKTIAVVFEIPTQQVRRFGLVMQIGPITAIQEESPAKEAGLAENDVIISVDGKPLSDGSADSAGWDPASLPNYFRLAALEGRTVELSVRKASENGDANGEPRTVQLKPRVPITYFEDLQPNSPVGVAAAGFAYQVENTVHAVVADSAAAAAGLEAGDKIKTAKLVIPESAKDEWGASEPLEFGDKFHNVPLLFTLIQFAPQGTAVEFTLQRGSGNDTLTKKLEPKAVDGLYVADRGLIFEPLTRIRQGKSFNEQVKYGWDETTEALLMVYRFLQKTWEGQVPLTAFGGPITIARAAGSEASKGISSLLIFLTMLSANLAVINFLPIPILDGGHMVFLAYEGIRGRPANERFVVAMHLVGFALIATLMVFVFGLDLGLIKRNL